MTSKQLLAPTKLSIIESLEFFKKLDIFEIPVGKSFIWLSHDSSTETYHNTKNVYMTRNWCMQGHFFYI